MICRTKIIPQLRANSLLHKTRWPRVRKVVMPTIGLGIGICCWFEGEDRIWRGFGPWQQALGGWTFAGSLRIFFRKEIDVSGHGTDELRSRKLREQPKRSTVAIVSDWDCYRNLIYR